MFKIDQKIFNVLFEAVSEGVIVVDEKQNIVFTNSSAERMFGYDEGELLNQTLNILIPKNYHAGHGAHFSGFMKHKESRQMGRGRDLFGARKDGKSFPVEAGLNPFEMDGKSFIMALVIDISVRKRADQERNHFAAMFDESLNEIFVFEENTLSFINANYGAQKNIGYSLDELKAITPVDIKPNFNVQQFKEVIAPLKNIGVDKIEFETVHQRKNGTTYPVEVHLQMSKLMDKNVYFAIILDITERKNHTEKLEKTVEERTKELKEALENEKELNELKTRFLSLVSHEFKTPLSGILTSAMLLSKYKLKEQQANRDKHIETITNKVHYLNNILNDFLSIEKLETGNVSYKFSTFKISKVVNEVVYNANMLLKEGQKINYPENIDHISLTQDEKIIELSLSNIVNNAIKYSPENSIVKIMINQDDENTTFYIEDNGIGIPKKDQKNIFNRYFRAENALLTQGTGIGLNIVKTHFESLGGTIKFESEENKGSIFTMTIPNKA